MELIVLGVSLVIVFLVFKKFRNLIFFVAIVDIFLRIVTFIKQNVTIPELYDFLNKYIPSSIPNIIDKHVSGFINEILIWLYVVVFIIFEYYIIRAFFRKK